MVKIVHMADTHLGYREGKGTINKWAIPNYSKPYEQSIYDAFKEVMVDVSKIKDLDFLVHCGDMFHIPSLNNSHPPPEPARRVLKNVLDTFFENTDNQVPIIYVEGNHGVFRGYEYTPFESHFVKKDYPNLYYFKERHLLESIKSNKPLNLEFLDKKVRFYLFPYFAFKSFESYKSAYDSWIGNQCPPENDEFINIAVAHGSKIDGTLHKKVRTDDFGYDYIALGHEHILKEETKNRYYAGCLLPLNFKEIYQNQGYIVVNIDNNTKNLELEKIFTQNLLKRPFDVVELNINPQDSLTDLTNSINEVLNEHISDDGFNAETSARLKLNFIGEMTIEKNWQINDLMAKIRRETFSKADKFNILQLIWQISDMSEYIEDDSSKGIVQDYILEKPDEEFKIFVEEKLSDDKSQFNIDKLTKFGMEAIKKALKIMDKEKEV
jgi:DNA repair exonuclease SbcCD nuclease subunit